MRDDLMVIILAVLGLILIIWVFATFISGLNDQQNARFSSWSNLCRQYGGTVQIVTPDDYECFKNGKIILHIE